MSANQIRSDIVVEGMGPYSQALRAGGWLLIAGQVAWDASGAVVGEGDMDAQARQVFRNIRALCEAAGGGLDDVVQIRTYLTDMSQAGVVSSIRREIFSTPYPTATTVEVSALVQPSLLIEVEAVALLNSE